MDRVADLGPQRQVTNRRVPRVAVVGGGWAGLAAAVELASQGAQCTVFEAARTAGGRARRVAWQTGGETLSLDNGQHILIGAYRHTLDLLAKVGVATGDAFERKRLHWVATNGFELQATEHRAPWHLAWAILRARHASIDERWALVSFVVKAKRAGWALVADCTVVELLRAWHQPPTLIHKFWSPLCIAALNTHEDVASAQVFLNVLRDSLGAEPDASDLLLPTVDLGSLLPDAAADWLVHRAPVPGQVLAGERVQNLLIDERGVVATTGTVTALGDSARFDAAVIATPPYEAARLLSAAALRDERWRELIARCEAFTFQPIVTVYLTYREAPGWSTRMLALDVAPHVEHFGQWAFDRSETLGDPAHREAAAPRGLVAVVISADGAHRDLDHPQLIAALARQLAVQCGLPTQFVDARVIVEKRATYASTPDLSRPDVDTPVPHLKLCGDYVSSPDPLAAYPATIEAAVRAGERAAASLRPHLATHPG